MGIANIPLLFVCFIMISFASFAQVFEDGMENPFTSLAHVFEEGMENSFASLAHVFEDGTEKGLQYGFYDHTCSQAEAIVSKVVRKNHFNNRDLPAGLIRMYFHDCFVSGCDASILLERSSDGSDVEKLSPINGKTLVGTKVIDEAKKILEAECPNTVSCADIIAFAAREAVSLAGLTHYRLPGGRRDGILSNANKVFTDLPLPSFSADDLTAKFASKGFSQVEMVVLSGAHSIGGAHCATFTSRLYNSTDDSMDSEFASILKESCPNVDYFNLRKMGKKVPFDMRSRRVLNTSYYKALMNGRGLLASDQALMNNTRTMRLVQRSVRRPVLWAERFVKAMVKLGALDVLVDDEGEIRRDCRFVN